MKKVESYETNLEHLQFDYVDDEGNVISLNSEEDIKEFLKRKTWKKDLIEAISFFKDNIKDYVIQDMVDLQKQIDELGSRVKHLSNRE